MPILFIVAVVVVLLIVGFLYISYPSTTPAGMPSGVVPPPPVPQPQPGGVPTGPALDQNDIPTEDTPKPVPAPVISLLPPGINNGDVVRCEAKVEIYKIDNNTKRFYSYNAWVLAGKPVPKLVPCNTIDLIMKGPDMPEILTNKSMEGKNVRCDIDGKIYKIENGQKRFYTFEVWDSYGKPSFENGHCDLIKALPNGPDMVKK